MTSASVEIPMPHSFSDLPLCLWRSWTMCCWVPLLAAPWWPVWIVCDRQELVRLYHIDDDLGFCLVSALSMMTRASAS